MQYRMFCVSLAAILLVASAWAADEAADRPKGVTLVAVGNMEDDLIERIHEFVVLNSAIPTRVLRRDAAADGSLAGEGRAFADVKDDRDIALVVWVTPGEREDEHIAYLQDEGIAVVNVGALRVDNEEQFARRMEKMTMRALAVLLGVEPVPNPQSALFTYTSIEELDAMGRNYDPPSLMRVQERAVQRGVQLIEDSPFRLVP